jgi:uncharacterized protein (DUF849 family)
MEKLVITAAVAGGITLPTQTQYLPITPQQIADEAVRAAEAGAACVHIHARNPKDGSPTTELEVYKEIITRIKDRSNVVIGITTGGGAGFTTEQRLKVVPAFKPELASCNMGSVSLSARSIAQRYKDEDYKYPWEKGYLRMLDDFVLKNTFTDLDIFMQTMRENHTKPELRPMMSVIFIIPAIFLEKDSSTLPFGFSLLRVPWVRSGLCLRIFYT